MKNQNYVELEDHISQFFKINNVINILKWDISTNLPQASFESRRDELAQLSSMAHSILKSSKTRELIYKAKEEVKNLDEWQLANLRGIERRYINAECIDNSLQSEYVLLTTQCEQIWIEAKKNNDFKILKPYLQKVITCVKELAKAKANKLGINEYDALLDNYDPGRKLEEVKSIFDKLKQAVPSLLQKICEKQKSYHILPISNNISISTQKEISKKVMASIGFDFSRGRIDESAHPFCGGTPHDVRLTTRYGNNFVDNIMNVLHETGHGLYEQNLPILYRDQPVGKANGMAIHESQSLLIEMQIGRSKEFIEFIIRMLRDEFKISGPEYTVENIYKLVTLVKPGFVRIDADEVSYIMHVVQRFEIEEMLLTDSLSVDDLPAYWDSKINEYLGITVNTTTLWCLQDIHWFKGYFGYFPVYANGAIIASMLMKKIKQAYPGLNLEISEGNLGTVNNFLNKEIRRYGSFKSTDQLIMSSTGERAINPSIFVSYLEQKYL